MNTSPAAPRCPALHGASFAHRPQDAYDALRAAGPAAWAEIAPGVHALVVTGHRAALDVLTDTETYSKDARRWRALAEGHVPPDSPVLGIMGWLPSLLYADGADHARLRTAMEDCLARIDPHHLAEVTRSRALSLIQAVAPAGEADLMAAYCDSLPVLVFAELLGCTPALTGRMVRACQGIINAGPEAGQAAADFAGILAELIQARRAQPGRDVTSWMLSHPQNLTDDEVLYQLYCLVGAGTIPTTAWIASTLRLLLTDDEYTSRLTGGGITVRRAMEQVLWRRSPLGTFATHYARHPTLLHGVPVPADVPVMVSHAATGTDPSLSAGLGTECRAHLAWSAGPHQCPARSHASVIAQTAIEVVLDRLWNVDLIEHDIPNRHGPFHQCPERLPVRFDRSDSARYTYRSSPAGGTA
ncbi:cytochrome P450 [Streptomyces sp. P38-E01]|uniref:Cytochrome P450 n=1 Tax=Streptomyces tardus TaxID=2780544 RepID=A0A949JPM3_9ACTN|nr:cytochrome P450 [Streptomyces tardus]MBU7598936.1 cytochrome P450 [Streptomyces tardus]